MTKGDGLRDDQLARFSRMVEEQLGLHFPSSQWEDLRRRISAAASKLGFDDSASCLDWFMEGSDPGKAIEELARHLTISETYFFRDVAVFRALETKIIPQLVAARSGTGRRLNIWSAGCASGEEAYSMAILLDRFFPFLRHWQISIYGTDIHLDMLDKARRALYSKWSFRDAPAWLLDTYFAQVDSRNFQLEARIRERVQFFRHNLATGITPAFLSAGEEMDIIMCRNVLMYFSEERCRLAVEGLLSVLAEGGMLLVSAGEISLINHPALHLVSQARTTFFIKQSRAQGESSPRQVQPSGQHPGPGPESKRGTAKAPGVVPVPPPSRNRETMAGLRASWSDNRKEGKGAVKEALVLYQQMKYRECIAVLAPLVLEGKDTAASDYSAVDLLLVLAKAHANLGDLQGAESWCERALAEDRLHPDSRYLRATILQEQGRPDEAMEELRHLLFLDPKCVMAHFASANILRQKGRDKEAAQHYRTVESMLKDCDPELELAYADGLTAGRLLNIIQKMNGAVP